MYPTRDVRQNVPRSRGAGTAGLGVDSRTQMEIMYMLERINEPLCLGPRGSKNVFFDVPLDNYSENERKASEMLRKSIKPDMTIKIEKPKKMPNLSMFGSLCPKSEIFSYFNPDHRQAAGMLTKMLMSPEKKEFAAVAAACRDSAMINSQLWLHCMIGATLFRGDLKGLKLPPLWEVIPDAFMSNAAKKIAHLQAQLPAETRGVISLRDPKEKVGSGNMVQEVSVDSSFAGRTNNPENKLWYFREDIGVNSHHWHWHIIYSGNAEAGARDRKGELFYYMHHSMIARYDAERLSNGLARVRPLDITARPVLEEGYFSKLTTENGGRNWGTRQEFSELKDVKRNGLDVKIEDMRRYYDRIIEAIDTGVYIDQNGVRQTLRSKHSVEDPGIDVIGAIVENGGTNYTPNEVFYGNLHNFGHVIIGLAYDPEHRHRENFGVMGAVETAMRDPAFYRWHKFVDDIFDRYKTRLAPYREEDLVWKDAVITNVEIPPVSDSGKNVLVTQWMQSDIDLSRGLDIGRSNMTRGPVWARATHLVHIPFTYNIEVNFNGSMEAMGTVRIFMAPRIDEHGQRFSFSDQHLLFFEMDKFVFKLRQGVNKITRKSSDSAVTIPWEQSFRDLEKEMVSNMNPVSAVCGCGWPQHLLLARGTPEGYPFDLFVMITDFRNDVPEPEPKNRMESTLPCKESLSFCGVLNEKYPDRKPMGFPFDRKPRALPGGVGTAMTLPDLDAFIPPNSNMKSVQVRIVHSNKVTVRPGGAPDDIYQIPVPEDGLPSSIRFMNDTSKSSASGLSRPRRAVSPQNAEEYPTDWENVDFPDYD